MSERFCDIEMIELLAIPKEQETEHQERYPSEITMRGMMISRLHLLFEMHETYDSKYAGDSSDIRQKADKQFACVVAREEDREKEYQHGNEYRRNHDIHKTLKTQKAYDIGYEIQHLSMNKKMLRGGCHAAESIKVYSSENTAILLE